MSSRLAVALAALAAFATACSRESPRRSEEHPRREPARVQTHRERVLDFGWQYACAIVNDDNDRAKCQEDMALACLEAGDIDKALDRGKQIAGWRKGVVLADVARRLAEQGETNRASKLVVEAQTLAESVGDWQGDYIKARATQALAAMDRGHDVAKIREFYETNLDYAGWLTAYHSLAMLRAGQTNEAVAALDGLASSTHFDTTVWRAVGYRLLAESGLLKGDPLTNLLSTAWSATTNVAGIRKWELQMDLAGLAARTGERRRAAEMMETVTEAIRANTNGDAFVIAPLMAGAARVWATAGDGAHVAMLEAETEPLYGRMEGIDHPAVIAAFAEARALAGDKSVAEALYVRALNVTAGLTNRRPRAMAGVEVCVRLARSGVESPAISEALTRVSATFGEVKK